MMENNKKGAFVLVYKTKTLDNDRGSYVWNKNVKMFENIVELIEYENSLKRCFGNSRYSRIYRTFCLIP